MSAHAVIAGGAEAPYTRSPGPETTTESLLVEASLAAIADAGLRRDDVDGLGVTSFTLAPDHAIDLAWRLGMRVRWLMEDTNGGAAGVNLLQHAIRAIESGDASTIVLVGGDRMLNREFIALSDGYNKAIRDHVAPIPADGPNTMFSAITQRHMDAHGLSRQDYGRVALAQRRWAALNPGAVYRTPLSMEEYLQAPPVAPPLGRYDCVPVVSGADAVVVTDRSLADGPAVAVRSIRAMHNEDQQEGDGIRTGLATVARDLWEEAATGPGEVDLACIYDDYPVMVLVQAADLGLVPNDDLQRFVRRRLAEEAWPLNTSGGQLSAGQAGAAAGLHGLVEACAQLRWRAGARQVEGARKAVVTGYGMVLYRYGACANATILERAQ
jgi:acetyl-CoA acetyltransferase